jgi:hypothetical protein
MAQRIREGHTQNNLAQRPPLTRHICSHFRVKAKFAYYENAIFWLVALKNGQQQRALARHGVERSVCEATQAGAGPQFLAKYE